NNSKNAGEPECYCVVQAVDARGTSHQCHCGFTFTKFKAILVCKQLYPPSLGYHTHEALTMEEALERIPPDQDLELIAEAETQARFLMVCEVYRGEGLPDRFAELEVLSNVAQERM